MRQKPVVTVDGLASTGKTTLSKLLASRLGYLHISTGLLYRAVGYLAHTNGVRRSDEKALAQMISSHTIELALHESNEVIILLDGQKIFDKLYAPEISEATSEVAVLSSVREALLPIQQEAFLEHGLVAEGRDMGTVVFPSAKVKFWIQTDQTTKVQRRMAQLMEREPKMPTSKQEDLAQKMKIEIHERDKRDQERGLAPSVKSSEMVLIDNSTKTTDAVLEEMLLVIQKKINL